MSEWIELRSLNPKWRTVPGMSGYLRCEVALHLSEYGVYQGLRLAE